MSNTNREASLITYFNQAKTLYMYKTLYDVAVRQGLTVRQELRDAPTRHLIDRIWGQSQLFRDGIMISPQANPNIFNQVQPQLDDDPLIIKELTIDNYQINTNPFLRIGWTRKEKALRYIIYDKQGNIRGTTTDTFIEFSALSPQQEVNGGIFQYKLKTGDLLQLQVRPVYLDEYTLEEEIGREHRYYSEQVSLIYVPNKAITDFNVTIGGDKAVRIVWNRPENIINSYPIEWYEIDYSNDNGFSTFITYMQPHFYGSDNYSILIQNLDPSQTYYFRIRGVNRVRFSGYDRGYGPYDNTPRNRSYDSIVVIGIPIVAPNITYMLVKDGGKSVANITWSMDRSIGYPVTEYEWLIADDNNNTQLSGMGTEQQVLGFRMKEGINYKITVRAKNEAGFSRYDKSTTFIYYLDPGVPDIRVEYTNNKVSLFQNYRDIRGYINSPTSPIVRIIIQNLYAGREIILTGENLYKEELINFDPEIDKLYQIRVIVSGKGGDNQILIPIKIINPLKRYITGTTHVISNKKIKVTWNISGGYQTHSEITGYKLLYINNDTLEQKTVNITGPAITETELEVENGISYTVRVSVKRYTAILHGDRYGDELTDSVLVNDSIITSGAPSSVILGEHIIGERSGEVELKWIPTETYIEAQVTGYVIVYLNGTKRITIDNETLDGIVIAGLVNHSDFTFDIYTRGRQRTSFDPQTYGPGPSIVDSYIYSNKVSVILTPHIPVISPLSLTYNIFATNGYPNIDLSWNEVNQIQIASLQPRYIVKYDVIYNNILLSGEVIQTATVYKPNIYGDYYGYTLNVKIYGSYEVNGIRYISKTPLVRDIPILPRRIMEIKGESTSLYNIREMNDNIDENVELVCIKWDMDINDVIMHLDGFRVIKENSVNGKSVIINKDYSFTFIETIPNIQSPFNNIDINDILYKVYKYPNTTNTTTTTYMIYVPVDMTSINFNRIKIEKKYIRDDNLVYYSPAQTSNNIIYYGIIKKSPEYISTVI